MKERIDDRVPLRFEFDIQAGADTQQQYSSPMPTERQQRQPTARWALTSAQDSERSNTLRTEC